MAFHLCGSFHEKKGSRIERIVLNRTGTGKVSRQYESAYEPEDRKNISLRYRVYSVMNKPVGKCVRGSLIF